LNKATPFLLLFGETLLAHVVLACATVESSSRKTRRITHYYLLILGYDGLLGWARAGTLRAIAKH
jgi:hypothetical protein